MEGYKDNSGFNAVFGSSGGGSAPKIDRYYGNFNSMLNVSASAINVASPIGIENTTMQNGVSLLTDGAMQYDNSGVYMINVTFQVIHQMPMFGGYAYFYLWYNGLPIPTTTRWIALGTNGAEVVLSLSYMVDILNPLDKINLVWEVDDLNMLLVANPYAPAWPDSPSVLVQTFQV
jgi:hypothetical protein